jgi:hypothetical protein
VNRADVCGGAYGVASKPYDRLFLRMNETLAGTAGRPKAVAFKVMLRTGFRGSVRNRDFFATASASKPSRKPTRRFSRVHSTTQIVNPLPWRTNSSAGSPSISFPSQDSDALPITTVSHLRVFASFKISWVARPPSTR